MTREEYLNELKTCILSLNNEEQSEALQYYSDYFDEAGDDEKVINELGKPEELAKIIIEKFANAMVETEPKASSEECFNKQTVGEDVVYYSYAKEDVKNVSFNFGAAEVVAIKGNKFAIESHGISADMINCHLSAEGNLTVNNAKRVNINFWSHDRKKSRVIPRILVTIPDCAEINRLKLVIGAGTFVAKDVSFSCKDGNLEVGAGNLVVNNLFGGIVNIRCGMGNLEFSGKIRGKSNIDCGMGSVKLNLSGKKEEYSYDVKVGLGDFRFNNEKKSGVAQCLDNERKENHFSVNCGMGSVNIKID